MADEPKNLSEMILNPEALPESIREKFAGKSVADVITSYEEAQKTVHDKSTELSTTKQELETLKTQQSTDEDDDDVVVDDEDDDLFSGDTYITKEVMQKNLAAIEKKNQAEREKIKDEAVNIAMAQIEKRQFIENHPEIFKGKSPEEADKTVKKIAGAGFVNGQNTLESSLASIAETAKDLGMVNESNEQRNIPADLNSAIDAYDNPEDEVSHMIDYHKKNSGNISSFLK